MCTMGWHQRLGSGVHADASMDRILHNTIWIGINGVNPHMFRRTVATAVNTNARNSPQSSSVTPIPG